MHRLVGPGREFVQFIGQGGDAFDARLALGVELPKGLAPVRVFKRRTWYITTPS
jgi:hypothetical protein